MNSPKPGGAAGRAAAVLLPGFMPLSCIVVRRIMRDGLCAERGLLSSLRVLVTGASGYVGGRLVPALVERDAEVRCLARTPAKLDAAPWRASVEVVRGDVGGDLAEAMRGVDVAVYLVHSIGQGDGWALREQRDALTTSPSPRRRRVCGASSTSEVWAEDDDVLSEHLRSRHEVGRLLASTGVEVVELRAGVIIGSGSASFEMLRYLVEVLPVMVTPRWVETRCQPIAIADIVDLLVEAVTRPGAIGGVYEVGGPDVVTYAEMMAPLRRGRRPCPPPPGPGAVADTGAVVALGRPCNPGTGPLGPRAGRVAGQ